MMNKDEHYQIVENDIKKYVSSLLPHGAGAITDHRLRHALEQVAQRAFQQGESYALSSLLTVGDVAEILNVSPRRVRAIAKNRHERFGVGWQVPGTNQWLFKPEEIGQLRPDEKYQPKN